MPFPAGLPHAVAGDRATISLADESNMLDFESGGFGHGARRVMTAVARQMSVNPLATRHFLSLPLARFAGRLADLCPGDLDVAYLCNSAAEAVEGALKLARGFHRERLEFVALEGSRHGTTLGALSVCGVEGMRSPFSRLPLRAVFADGPDGIEELVDRRTAAVVVEPWPGGDGRSVAKAGWLRRLAARCSATGTQLIADETRSGVGRTGAMFAIEHEGVVPDVLVLGGALGGGVLPVAGYVATRSLNDRVYGRRDPTLHASATGGNPAACAAGMATLDMIADEDLLAAVRAKGALLGEGVTVLRERHRETIDATHGVGLFFRIDFHSAGVAEAVAAEALDRGLASRLAGGGSSSIELCPPLLVGRDEIERGLEILGAALLAVAPSGAAR